MLKHKSLCQPLLWLLINGVALCLLLHATTFRDPIINVSVLLKEVAVAVVSKILIVAAVPTFNAAVTVTHLLPSLALLALRTFAFVAIASINITFLFFAVVSNLVFLIINGIVRHLLLVAAIAVRLHGGFVC